MLSYTVKCKSSHCSKVVKHSKFTFCTNVHYYSHYYCENVSSVSQFLSYVCKYVHADQTMCSAELSFQLTEEAGCKPDR